MYSFMADVQKNDWWMTREMIEEHYPEFADNIESALQLQAEIAPIVSKGEAVKLSEIQKYYPELLSEPKFLKKSEVKIEKQKDLAKWALKGMFRPQEDKERNDNLFGRLKATDEATTVGGVLKEFWINTLKSAVNLASDVGNMVANPWDTAKGLAQWVLWGVANAIGADDWLAERSDFWAGVNETADAIGGALAERYGSWEKFSKTAYTDPVGVFSDIMSVIAPVAGATKTGAKLGTKGAQVTKLTKTSWKLAKVADVAGDIAKVADAADPANIMMKGVWKVVWKGVPYGIQWVKKGTEIINKGIKHAGESIQSTHIYSKTKNIVWNIKGWTKKEAIHSTSEKKSKALSLDSIKIR